MLFSPLGWRIFLEDSALYARTFTFSHLLIIQQLIPAAKPEGRPRSLKSGRVANVTHNFARHPRASVAFRLSQTSERLHHNSGHNGTKGLGDCTMNCHETFSTNAVAQKGSPRLA